MSWFPLPVCRARLVRSMKSFMVVLGHTSHALSIGEDRPWAYRGKSLSSRRNALVNKVETIAVLGALWIVGGMVLGAQAGEVDYSTSSADQYWVGKGQGDLAKGKVVCQRVSELSARTDLAKQIRVLVKEHMVDRVRERSGRESEQDIELTREEIVQEYLQDVKIVDRRIDEENKICTATAIMPKSRVQLKPVTDQESGQIRLP
jgi:hypothetical protein